MDNQEFEKLPLATKALAIAGALLFYGVIATAIAWWFLGPLYSVMVGLGAMALIGIGMLGQARDDREKRKWKDCPYCAETIKSSAIKCKHCGSTLSVSGRSSQAPKSSS